MCLDSVKGTRTLKKAITVYKVFQVQKGKLCGPIFSHHKYKPGANESGVLRKGGSLKLGIYCFPSRRKAQKLMDHWNAISYFTALDDPHLVLECTIPAGTTILQGYDGDDLTYVTPTIFLPAFDLDSLVEGALDRIAIQKKKNDQLEVPR